MKKIFTYLSMAVLALTSFTSCDKDSMEAFTLSGTWTGYIETYYADRWGWTGDTYRTTIYFNQRDMYGGTGRQVDYNVNNPYSSYYYSDFEWEVRDGVITLWYSDSWNPVRIYDYSLNLSRFYGYMDDGTRRDIYFELTSTYSFNWNNYDTYYSRMQTRAGEADSNGILKLEDGSELLIGKGFHAKGEFLEAIKAQRNLK